MKLAHKGAASLAIRIVGIGLAFAVSMSLARALGPIGFGRYSYVFSILTILAIPAQLGLPKLIVRETAKANVNNSWASVRGLWQWASAVIGIFTLVIILGLILVSAFTEQEEQTLLLLGAILVPLLAFGNIRGAAMRGLNYVIVGQIPETIFRPLIFVCLIVTLYSSSKDQNLSPETAMTLYILASGVAFLFGAFLLSRLLPNELRQRPKPVYHSKKWILSLVPLGLIAGIQTINSNLDIVMLGAFRTPEEVGVYKVVVITASLVSFGLQAINMVIMPQVARLYAKQDIQGLQRIVTLSARLVFVLAILTSIGFLLMGRWFLYSAFGSEYAQGYEILVVLAVGQLANATFGSVVLLLNMGGYEKDALLGVFLAACVNVILNFMLIPIFGGWGAALATSITLIIWNAFLCWRVYCRMGINSTAFSFNNWTKAQ